MDKNVPKLRFKEFNDEWKIDKLDENTYIKGRIGWKNLKQEEYTEEGPYLIAGKHIHNGVINWELCDHISTERYEESLEIALQNGDIIFSKDGSLGNPALIENLNEKATINGTMMLIRLDENKYSSKYFYQVLQSVYFKKLIRNVKSGSSIPHIFQRDMIEFKFPITSLQEQKKIANFFTVLDNLIEEQDGKIRDLELYKKGMMQQIFKQKIRFKDENGQDYPAWEEKKLDEVCDIVGGGTPSTLEESFWNGGIQWFTPTEIKDNKYAKKSLRTITNLGVNKSSAKILPVGSILLTTRATLGEMAILTTEATTNQGFQSLVVKNNINNEFIYYLGDKIKKYCYKSASGSTFLEISKSVLGKFKFKYPCLEEQTKIANFLSNIDNIIEEEQNNLDDLKEMKKGLLQQMFV